LGDTHTESRDDQYRQQNSFHVWFHRSVELTVGSGHTRSTAFGYTEPVAVASQLSANRSFSGAEVDLLATARLGSVARGRVHALRLPKIVGASVRSPHGPLVPPAWPMGAYRVSPSPRCRAVASE
jgi:hypothetical protein